MSKAFKVANWFADICCRWKGWNLENQQYFKDPSEEKEDNASKVMKSCKKSIQARIRRIASSKNTILARKRISIIQITVEPTSWKSQKKTILIS
jgi:hypothetical protein